MGHPVVVLLNTVFALISQALIRHCYSCKKPFFKQDGCNKMTCECGAKMCYLCRKPVTDYRHFYGQGGAPGGQAKCPLWSDNKTLHDSDVAKGAFDAKSEMDQVYLDGIRWPFHKIS